jgi:hypothetical protein
MPEVEHAEGARAWTLDELCERPDEPATKDVPAKGRWAHLRARSSGVVTQLQEPEIARGGQHDQPI